MQANMFGSHDVMKVNHIYVVGGLELYVKEILSINLINVYLVFFEY